MLLNAIKMFNCCYVSTLHLVLFQGVTGISDYPISFHYCSTEVMYDLEYYVYHMRPYGILSGLQDINVHNRTEESLQEKQAAASQNQSPK